MHTEPGPWGPELIGQSRGCSLHVLFMGIRPVKFPQLTEIVTSPLLCAAHGRDLDKWVSARPPPTTCPPPAHPGGCSPDRGWLGSLPANPQNSALTCPSASHEHRRSCPRQPASAACSCPQRERPVRKDPRELHRKSPKHRRSAGHPPTTPSENGACQEPRPQHRGDIRLSCYTKTPGYQLAAGLETPKQEPKVGLCLASLFFFLTCIF